MLSTLLCVEAVEECFGKPCVLCIYIYELYIIKMMSDVVHEKSLNKNFYVRLQQKFKDAYQRAVTYTNRIDGKCKALACVDDSKSGAGKLIRFCLLLVAANDCEKKARARARWQYAVRQLKPTNVAMNNMSLKTRYNIIRDHYPGSLDMEEFVLRLESSFYRLVKCL